jgi:hypothetical protein
VYPERRAYGELGLRATTKAAETLSVARRERRPGILAARDRPVGGVRDELKQVPVLVVAIDCVVHELAVGAAERLFLARQLRLL